MYIKGIYININIESNNTDVEGMSSVPSWCPAGRPVYLYVPVMGSFSLLSLGTNNSREAGGAEPDLALTSQWEGGREACCHFLSSHTQISIFVN